MTCSPDLFDRLVTLINKEEEVLPPSVLDPEELLSLEDSSLSSELPLSLLEELELEEKQT